MANIKELTKKNEMKDLTKDMNQEQKEKYKEDLIKKKKDEQVKLKLEKKLLKDKEKEYIIYILNCFHSTSSSYSYRHIVISKILFQIMFFILNEKM